jgi:hypothetical protein
MVEKPQRLVIFGDFQNARELVHDDGAVAALKDLDARWVYIRFPSMPGGSPGL